MKEKILSERTKKIVRTMLSVFLIFSLVVGSMTGFLGDG